MRYQVMIRSGLGQIRKLRVLTWLGPEKAIAMAVHADGHGYGSRTASTILTCRN